MRIWSSPPLSDIVCPLLRCLLLILIISYPKRSKIINENNFSFHSENIYIALEVILRCALGVTNSIHSIHFWRTWGTIWVSDQPYVRQAPYLLHYFSSPQGYFFCHGNFKVLLFPTPDSYNLNVFHSSFETLNKHHLIKKINRQKNLITIYETIMGCYILIMQFEKIAWKVGVLTTTSK